MTAASTDAGARNAGTPTRLRILDRSGLRLSDRMAFATLRVPSTDSTEYENHLSAINDTVIYAIFAGRHYRHPASSPRIRGAASGRRGVMLGAVGDNDVASGLLAG